MRGPPASDVVGLTSFDPPYVLLPSRHGRRADGEAPWLECPQIDALVFFGIERLGKLLLIDRERRSPPLDEPVGFAARGEEGFERRARETDGNTGER